MTKRTKIFVCPLDWGIGHATRCVPLIRELMEQHAEVVLGTSGRSFDFLKRTFPELELMEFPGYTFSYPSNGSMALMMLKQVPRLLHEIKKEHLLLEKLVEQNQFDAVISDNRYGAYSAMVPSVFMTHQVFIRTPAHLKFMEPLLFRMTRTYISQFNECWIPDYPGNDNLSGELSHRKPLPGNYHFIGPMSRFSDKKSDNEEKRYDLLAMISGPEPQRSIFEEKIIGELEQSKFQAAIVSGKTESMTNQQVKEKITMFSHLDTHELQTLIHQSKLIISRPGYSTLMDLAVLGAKAVFVPTPGQTEQEYLARRMMDEGKFPFLSQKDFTIKKARDMAHEFEGLRIDNSGKMLKKRLNAFVQEVHSG